MAENLGTGQKGKKNEFVRAILDLVILALLIGGAGLGGYWYGLHEQVVPVSWVPRGTDGAIEQDQIDDAKPVDKPASGEASKAAPAKASTKPGSTGQKSVKKYWLTSSGTDFIGYSITVSVNGDQVDGFFGPGKIVDITSKVRPGDNSILFESKQLGEDYNKHPGDKQAELVVKLVSGGKIHEDFKPEDVKITYKRNASERTDFQDTKHFNVKDK